VIDMDADTDMLKRYQEARGQHEQAVTDSFMKAKELLFSGRAPEANAMLEELLQATDVFYAEWGERLCSRVASAEDASQCRVWIDGSLTSEKRQVLEFLGISNQLMGKLEDAQANLLEAQQLLGIQKGDKSRAVETAMISHSIGQVSYQRGLFSNAEEHFLQAYSGFENLEQWDPAVQALTELADCSYAQGKRAAFLDYLDKGTQLASTHGLRERESSLILKKLSFRLDSDPTDETLVELRALQKDPQKREELTKDPSLQINIDQLLADQSFKRNDLVSAKEYLQHALQTARGDPDKEWSVRLQCAAVYDFEGRAEEAVKQAERAFNGAQYPSMKQSTLKTLIPLRLKTKDARQRALAMEEMQTLRGMGPTDELALALLNCALVYYSEGDYTSALADIQEAQSAARTSGQYSQCVKASIAPLQAMGRENEALIANRRAIELLNERLAPEGELSLAKWRDTLMDFVALNENAAVLSARQGNLQEAFDFAEASKARLLRVQLAERRRDRTSSDVSPGDAAHRAEAQPSAQPVPDPQEAHFSSQVKLDELTSWLASESAGMAVFCVGGRESLVIVIDPTEPEPSYKFIPLTEGGLKTALSVGDEGGGPHQRNEAVFQAAATLSDKLLAPLDSVTRHCNLLYIVPDSRLYSVPFSALSFDDGTALIDRCATAYVPSATVLRSCRARRKDRARKSCVALGVGQEEDISFAEETRIAVSEYPWAQITWLLDDDATIANFNVNAPRADVVHLSCHGMYEDETAMDTLSASWLELANKARVTAKDIFSLQTPLDAELVFLNACVSGIFELIGGTELIGGEVGGFWEAFLFVGANSLVTTLAFVNPVSAHALAREFYREWRNGLTKAEALRRAQLRMRQQYGDAQDWASHILVGDHY